MLLSPSHLGLMYFQSKNSSSYYYLYLISYTFTNKRKNKKILFDINLCIDNHEVYECTSCTLHIIYLLIQAALDEATEPWGIKVERVEM